MKHLWKLALCSAAVAACDSTSEIDLRENVRLYDMVSFMGRALPQEIGPVDGVPNCVDSLMARSVELTTATQALWTTNEIRNCSGVRSTRNLQRSGTYTIVADTVDFTWQVNDPIINGFNEEAVFRAGGTRLEFLQRTYSEADPDGNQRSVYAVFQRR